MILLPIGLATNAHRDKDGLAYICRISVRYCLNGWVAIRFPYVTNSGEEPVTAPDDKKILVVAEASSSVTPGEDKWLKLTREDLAASVAAYRQGQELRNGWKGAVPVLGGLVGSLGLMNLGTLLGWPASLEPYFFVGGWAVALGALVRILRKDRRLLARCQWYCPACNAEMIASRGTNRLTRAETAIATGRCPVCGHALFESDSLGAPKLEPG